MTTIQSSQTQVLGMELVQQKMANIPKFSHALCILCDELFVENLWGTKFCGSPTRLCPSSNQSSNEQSSQLSLDSPSSFFTGESVCHMHVANNNALGTNTAAMLHGKNPVHPERVCAFPTVSPIVLYQLSKSWRSWGTFCGGQVGGILKWWFGKALPTYETPNLPNFSASLVKHLSFLWL